MKGGKNMRQMKEEYEERVVGLCCVCSKPVTGWYGANQEGGTCSKSCEQVYSKREKYEGHTEEDFFNRMKE